MSVTIYQWTVYAIYFQLPTIFWGHSHTEHYEDVPCRGCWGHTYRIITVTIIIIIIIIIIKQRSSDSTEENGNHTEETQHGPSQSPPNIVVGHENGKKMNKRIRWSQEKMKEVLWCCKTRSLRRNL
jgi:hypothetical protein